MRMLHEDPRNHMSFWMAQGLAKCLNRLKYAKCQNMVRGGNLFTSSSGSPRLPRVTPFSGNLPWYPRCVLRMSEADLTNQF